MAAVLRSMAIWFTLLGVLFIARPATALEVQINASVDADRVEVGDTFSYALNVVVSGGPMPSDPQPGTVTGFTVVGAGSSPMQMRMNMNGAASTVNSLTTTWSLRANKVGTFVLGPASATVHGQRRAASPVRVTVVPRGQGGAARSRSSPFSGSPFDPFANSPFRGLFGMDDEREAPKPTADAKLNLDKERGAVAFLHATVDKTRAALGEQVTLNIYLYADPYVRQVRVSDVHEATTNDFVKRSLLEDESRAIDLGTAMVGGRIWSVKLVRKNALFPLKTGRLEIEPMSVTLVGVPSGQRRSEALHVNVTEPPIADRPPGYALGDVGNFALSATVSPRSVDQDGAVGVTLEIRGTGNLPGKLTLPVVRGVEWLEASSRDSLGAAENDRFGGTRTFSYVVRFREPGAVDLGEVRLPYYDADKKTYAVASAPLGIVEVKAGRAHDAGAQETEVLLANLPVLRRTLEGRRTESFLSDRAWFWAVVFGLPVACVFAMDATKRLRIARERRAERAPSPARVAKARRAEAKTACEGTDAKAALGAIVRAIVAALVAETGVNLRGVSVDVARGELRAAGMGEDITNKLLSTLKACEDAQFSPDGTSMAQAREMWAQAETVLLHIERDAR